MALNGKPPYHKVQSRTDRLQIAEDLLVLSCYLANSDLIKHKSLQLLNRPGYYSSRITSPTASETDEYQVIAGFTAASLRRILEQELIDYLPFNGKEAILILARITALEAMSNLSEKTLSILQEYRERARKLGLPLPSSLPESPAASSSGSVASKPRPLTIPSTVVPSGLFIFDRDHTLIDDGRSLINPGPILQLITNLDRDPRLAWGIASAGSTIDLTTDPGLIAIRQSGYQGSPPLYSLVGRGRGAVSNRLESIDFELLSTTGKQLDISRLSTQILWLKTPPPSPSDGIYLVKHPFETGKQVCSIYQDGHRFQITLDWVLSDNDLKRKNLPALYAKVVSLITEHEILRINQAAFMALMSDTRKQQSDHYTASDQSYEFRYPSQGTVILRYGETRYTMQLQALANPEIFNLIDLGDWKLFFVFDLLDKAQLTLSIQNCPQLQELGITKVSSPLHYREVSQNNIVFTDDKPTCVTLIARAGFRTILADTDAAMRERAKESEGNAPGQNSAMPSELNTYVQKLLAVHQEITDSLAPVEQYVLRHIKEVIQYEIITGHKISSAKPREWLLFHDAQGDKHSVKIPRRLKVMLDKIHELERNPDEGQIIALINQFVLILNKKAKSGSTFSLSKNTDFYQNLLNQVTSCQRILVPMPSMEPMSSSSHGLMRLI
jgi:hypothetical protein